MINIYDQHVKRLTKDLGYDMNMIHSALGAASEAGEFADQIKAHIVYGRDLDTLNLIEEAGDAIFFLIMGMQQHGFTLRDVLRVNMAKLNARYSEGYSDAAANNRKKEFEREVMQKALGATRAARGNKG